MGGEEEKGTGGSTRINGLGRKGGWVGLMQEKPGG